MPVSSPSNRKLRTNNTVNAFANLTPIKKTKGGILDGLVGILRIIGIVAEIGLSIVFPAFAPAIALGGGIFQQGLDIYSFMQTDKSSKDIANFTLGSLVNIIPTALVARDFRASKTVLRISDKTASNGFRYVIKGIDPEYSSALSKVGLNKGVDTISIARQKNLINKGVLPKLVGKTKMLNMETALQYSFNKVVKKPMESGYKGNKYWLNPGDNFFSNRDLAILRNEARMIAKGKRLSKPQIWQNLNKLSKSAKSALGMNKTINYRSFFSSMKRANRVIEQLNSLSILYIKDVAKRMPIKRTGFKKVFHWFGTHASSNRPVYKSGTFWTQAAQLTNPNDMARELLNKPTGALLNGFKFKRKGNVVYEFKGLKSWTKATREKLEKKLPRLYKVIKSPFSSKALRKFNIIKNGLEKNGILVKDTEFLMGWRVIDKWSKYSQVVFYFNPITTRAKTPGSLNFNGKSSFYKTVPNKHLDALQKSLSPGSMYLKGAHGFPPIALSPGGRRPVNMHINDELLQFATLILPINPLRNILSLVSNTKNVITDLAQGTYFGKWKNTFTATFQRLWVNKVTKIVGTTLGGMVNREVGQHLSRLLKTTAQGFQRTKTKTVYINGRRVVKKYTSFSFNNKFNPNALFKQGIPLSFKSFALKRSPQLGAARQRQKITRYGQNIRRVPGIGVSFLK